MYDANGRQEHKYRIPMPQYCGPRHWRESSRWRAGALHQTRKVWVDPPGRGHKSRDKRSRLRHPSQPNAAGAVRFPPSYDPARPPRWTYTLQTPRGRLWAATRITDLRRTPPCFLASELFESASRLAGTRRIQARFRQGFQNDRRSPRKLTGNRAGGRVPRNNQVEIKVAEGAAAGSGGMTAWSPAT
jgi:hypothetical protein